jgi:hypothetical protein
VSAIIATISVLARATIMDETHASDSRHGKVLLGPAHLRGGLVQVMYPGHLMLRRPRTTFRLGLAHGFPCLPRGVRQLERHAGSSIARLRVVTHTIWTDYTDLDLMLDLFKQSLARKQPLMVIWDVRSLTFPRVKAAQVAQVTAFVGEYAEAFDDRVQAHIIILSNPVVRAFARLLLHFFEPPQPYTIAKDDAAADAFAEECGKKKPRSFRKPSYDKTSKFAVGGAG